MPAEYSLEIEDLSWKAQLEGVSVEKHTRETCCKEKVNVHEQPAFEKVIPLGFPGGSQGVPQCLRPLSR